jgi:hypothetical protein
MLSRARALDWSARSAPSPARPVADALGAAAAPDGSPVYRRSRDQMSARVEDRLAAAPAAGERLLPGIDVALGHPAGLARALTDARQVHRAARRLLAAIPADFAEPPGLGLESPRVAREEGWIFGQG